MGSEHADRTYIYENVLILSMKNIIIVGLLFALVFVSGCPAEGGKTCSDGSFVLGRSSCPAGTTYKISVNSYSVDNFKVEEWPFDRMTADLTLDYTVNGEYPDIAVYPVGYEESREFLNCTSGSCHEVVEWYNFKVTEYDPASGYYEATYRLCGYEDDPYSGEYCVCKDLPLSGYLIAV